MIERTRSLRYSFMLSDHRIEGLEPIVSINFDANSTSREVKIVLEGIIIGDSSERLAEFFDEIADLQGRYWRVNMRKLKVMSYEAAYTLVAFAKMLKRRGVRLEIESVHENVLDMMRLLNIEEVFSWSGEAMAFHGLKSYEMVPA